MNDIAYLLSCRQKWTGWQQLEVKELRGYFGLLILAGVYRSKDEATSSLWDDFTGRPVFKATMSLFRFRQLSRAIRMDDKGTREQRQRGHQGNLAAIQPLWGQWQDRLGKMFNCGDHVCIDEQLLQFKGGCEFRVYMKSKPAKFGVKFWIMADCQTSYCARIQVYTGKPTKQSRPEKGQGSRVVMDLMTERSGGTVTTDNFFTSMHLAKLLSARRIGLLGTLRQNKPELPPVLLLPAAKQRDVLSSLFAFTPSVTTVSYVPKKNKNVLLLSSTHQTPSVSEEKHKKPAMILDYNQRKGAVDTLDGCLSRYTVKRRSNRWPMAILGNMLDISAYNAYVLYVEMMPGWHAGDGTRRRLFLQELGRELVEGAMEARQRVPHELRAAALVKDAKRRARARESQAGPSHPPPAPAPEVAGRRACGYCSGRKARVLTSCSLCGQALCKAHGILMCPGCIK